MKAVAFLVLAACGGSAKKTWTVEQPPKSARTVDHWTEADEDIYIGRSCKNVVGPDGNLRCPALKQAGISATDCPGSMKALRASAETDKQRMAFRLVTVGLSYSDSCDQVVATFQIAAMSMYVDPVPAGGCARTDMFGPFALTDTEMRQRRGQSARLFSDTPSTLESPIQVCGVQGELAWLTRVTCADGSQPWAHDKTKAHSARKGSNTSNRACGKSTEPVPVDIYEVTCPEKRYDVYIDMYECGPGEQFQ